MPWRRFQYDIVDSTNERAFDAIERGEARHGDLFIARTQTVGRGTHGRKWNSAPGGLYVSAVVESEALPSPGAWTIAGAMAVHDVASAAGVDVSLRWPNDLVSLDDEKIAGVLAESRGLRPGGPAVFVLGIGVNVEGAALSLELRAARPVTSLRELGANVDVTDVENSLAIALETWVEKTLTSPKDVYAAFFARCTLANQEVVVTGAERGVVGIWTGLDPNLGLRIESEGGRVQHVSVAHVRGVRPVARKDGR